MKRSESRGFGLAESLISVAFTGMALAGAFSVSVAAKSAAGQTALRQELLYVGESVFEHLRYDRRNIDNYAFSLELSEASCEALNAPDMTDAQSKRLTWCRRLNALAPYRAGEVREIRIDTPEDGKRIVEIALQARVNGRSMPQEFIAKRVFEIPPS